MAALVAVIIGVGVYPATIVDVLESGVAPDAGRRLGDAGRPRPHRPGARHGGRRGVILIWDLLPSGKPSQRRAASRCSCCPPRPGRSRPPGRSSAAHTRRVRARASPTPSSSTTLSFFFSFLFAGITAAVVLASQDYAKRFGDYEAEFYALILVRHRRR